LIEKKMFMRDIKTVSLAMICSILLLGLTGVAAESAETTVQEVLTGHLEQGRKDYIKGNYEEALQHFLKAEKAEPENATVQYNIGLTYQGMLNYPKAEEAFARAVEFNPSMGDAWSHLGEMLYRRGSHAEARAALESAESSGARSAYTAYIKGLVLMALEAYDEAIASLQRSRELEPAFRQKATYAIGMVYSKMKNKPAAEKAFKEAIDIDPRSVVGVYANFGLQFLHKPQKRLWHLDLTYSFQYDDNVILNPGGVSAVPTDQNDFTHVLNLHAGYKPETKGPFGIRADANYFKSLHHQLSFIDLDGFGLSVTPSYTAASGTLSLEARADFYLVGSNHYLDIYSAYPSFGFDIGKRQHGIINGAYQKKNFFNQPLNIAAENRNASNYSVGYMHYVYVRQQRGYVGLGYSFDIDNTRGSNWDYFGHRFLATILYPLGKGIGFRFYGDYYLQNYRNVHTIFGVKRDDKTLTLSPMLTYDTKWVTLQLHYTHVRAISNVAIYDYNRNIYGAGLEFSY